MYKPKGNLSLLLTLNSLMAIEAAIKIWQHLPFFYCLSLPLILVLQFVTAKASQLYFATTDNSRNTSLLPPNQCRNFHFYDLLLQLIFVVIPAKVSQPYFNCLFWVLCVTTTSCQIHSRIDMTSNCDNFIEKQVTVCLS